MIKEKIQTQTDEEKLKNLCFLSKSYETLKERVEYYLKEFDKSKISKKTLEDFLDKSSIEMGNLIHEYDNVIGVRIGLLKQNPGLPLSKDLEKDLDIFLSHLVYTVDYFFPFVPPH